jgi:hypothetical protein
MAKVNIFIAPPPGDLQRPFGILPAVFHVSRVPVVGEVIALGEDTEGKAADYRVVLVHHIPRGVANTDVEAEVYAVRVYMPDLVEAAGKTPNIGGAPLKLK